MDERSEEGRRGRWVVIGLIALAVLLGLVALQFRSLMPERIPPTTAPATAPAKAP